MKTLLKLFVTCFVLSITTGAWAAPLTNGDFSAGGASWIDVPNSFNTYPGNASLFALNFPPATGTATGADYAAAVQAATTGIVPGGFNSVALAALTGQGSGTFQTFDRSSGNAGNIIVYDVVTFPAGQNNFAYFLDIDNGLEQLVSINSLGTSTPFAFNGSSNNLLVGFGVFRQNATLGAFNLQIDNVQQVPEINASSASLPLAAIALGLLILGDKRRKNQSVIA